MATFAWPTDRLVQPQTLSWGEMRKIRSSGSSPLGGDDQTSEVAYSHRWRADIVLPPTPSFAERAYQEAWLSRLKSGANRTTFHHFQHPAPYGSVRGSPYVASAYAQGVTSITIVAPTGGGLKAGDMMGITTTATYAIQLVRIMVDIEPVENAMTVLFEPALRASTYGGAPVIWDKPAALFKLMDSEWSQTSSARNAQQIALSFIEVLS